jgi:hypothetical protein
VRRERVFHTKRESADRVVWLVDSQRKIHGPHRDSRRISFFVTLQERSIPDAEPEDENWNCRSLLLIGAYSGPNRHIFRHKSIQYMD